MLQYFCNISRGLEDSTIDTLKNIANVTEPFSPCDGRVIFTYPSDISLLTDQLRSVERLGLLIQRLSYADFYPVEEMRKSKISHGLYFFFNFPL